MNQQRKEQLNKKLTQIYEYGSGRTEGVIESLLQERFLGHIYFIHEIGESTEHVPFEEYDFEDKSFTLVEFGLYQEGNACIETFEVPVSNGVLQDLAARIDVAYYQWMQREPQMLRATEPFTYYSWLLDVAIDPPHNWVEEEFVSFSKEERTRFIDEMEWSAFLPPRNVRTTMEEG